MTGKLVIRLASPLILLALLLPFGAAQNPSLPISITKLSGWAAGKTGQPSAVTRDARLPSGTLAQYVHSSPPVIEVDLDHIAQHYGITTGAALLVLVQGSLLHEYIHQSGYGSQSTSGWKHDTPPTTEDCEHFQMHIGKAEFICDSIQNWLPATSTYASTVVAELCAAYKKETKSIDETIAGFLPECAGTDVKDIGDVQLPTISGYSPSSPDCNGCP